MKRVNSRIDYNETGVFKINELTERYFFDWFDSDSYSWMRVSYLTAYHICNVYTNQDTVLNALQKLNGHEATYQVVYDTNRVIVTEPQRSTVLNKIQYNDYYNCHGFTFLDGNFWFLLDSDKVETIIQEDGYIPTQLHKLTENGVCLYYNNIGELIHSARVVNGVILSKFGINNIMTEGEEEILVKYESLYIDHTRTRYFNRQNM